MKVVAFIEPPQGDVIEEILTHCGLWQSPTPRGPPGVDGLVLELDAAYWDSAIDSPDQADESQDLTYVDIDTFLADFQSSPARVGMGTVRTSCAIEPYFALSAVQFTLR